TSGVVGAALAVLDAPQERALFVQAALGSTAFYVGGLGEDGYCEEGTVQLSSPRIARSSSSIFGR
ncbi:MAG TPA: hypothetical protein VIM58_04715, partial [Candidatus Methylacidiphilales bacterium]